MGELGVDAERIHRETGAAIRAAGVDRLLAVGALSHAAVEGFGDNAEWFDTVDALTDRAAALLGPGVTLLVKGSRSAGMERVIAALAEMPRAAGEGR